MRLNGLLELAIEQAICEIFDGEIPMDDPFDTSARVIKSIENYLSEDKED